MENGVTKYRIRSDAARTKSSIVPRSPSDVVDAFRATIETSSREPEARATHNAASTDARRISVNASVLVGDDIGNRSIRGTARRGRPSRLHVRTRSPQPVGQECLMAIAWPPALRCTAPAASRPSINTEDAPEIVVSNE